MHTKSRNLETRPEKWKTKCIVPKKGQRSCFRDGLGLFWRENSRRFLSLL